MSENEEEVNVSEILGTFKDKYNLVLKSLDQLYKGVFDEDDAQSKAALCLIAQAALFPILASSDLKARSMKRDIDFVRANVYAKLKDAKPADGKKMTETALAQLLAKDDEVKEAINLHNEAEKDFKNLSNVLALLKEAHLTFRSIKKVQ